MEGGGKQRRRTAHVSSDEREAAAQPHGGHAAAIRSKPNDAILIAGGMHPIPRLTLAPSASDRDDPPVGRPRSG